MVFSSTVFLFLFLPVVLTGYLLTPTIRLRNLFLLVASLVFYAWGEGFYLLLMLASIGMNYLGGVLLDRYRGQQISRLIIGLVVSANLLLLGAFKYANFATDNFNIILGWLQMPLLHLEPIHLPIGISFFTFQAMSYAIDIYRGEARAQRNVLDCGLYIALFPQLIAGPIVRYHDIADQLADRSITLQRFTSGIMLFVIGLGKKMLIANPMGGVADQIFAIPAAELNTPLAWTGALTYTLQIFYDFSGYSDMAIGLGRMLGFEFLANFNYPYIARSFREFWHRWHISLSNWFRDYLYIPLGGNRFGAGRTGLNLCIVFFLCGLWHGASWNFIVWGMLHGLLLVAERGRFGRLLARCWRPIRHGYLLLGVMIGWVIFRTDTLTAGMHFLTAMFGFGSTESLLHPLGLYWTKHTLIVCSLGLVGSMPFFPWLENNFLPRIGNSVPLGQALICCGEIVFLVLIMTACAMELAAGTHNPFIYFRF